MFFRDQVVLVTGAASGIGRALATRMGRDGAILALVDRNEEGLAAFRDELKAAGVRCGSAVADLRERDQTRAAVEQLAAELGPIDVAIPCAGICGVSIVDDLKVVELEEIVRINFLGVVYTIEAVLPGMLQRERGRIVGMASLAAFRGLPFESAYCASKAALASYLESLRPALRRRGVVVTTVFPGFVNTPLLTGVLTATGTKSPRGTVEVEKAAEKIVRAVRRGHRVCCFPWTTSWLAYGARWLPPAVYDWAMTRMAARIPLPY